MKHQKTGTAMFTETARGPRRSGVASAAAALLATTFMLPAAHSASAAEVTLYGRAHMSVDWLDAGDESGTYVSSNSSRLGVRASRDIGGLNAHAKYESRVALDDGDGAFGLFTGARESFLGIGGDFGIVRAGRITAPMQTHWDRFQLFGDQAGDVGDFIGGGGRGNRYGNTLVYSTSDWWTPADPYRVTVGVIPPGNDEDAGFLLGLDYESGPLFLGLSANYFGSDSPMVGGTENVTAFQLLGNYRAGSTRLFGIVSSVQNRAGIDGADDMAYVLGITHNINPSTVLKAQVLFYDADAADSDASAYTLGADYFLDARTRLYFAVSVVDNDDLANFTPWGWGYGDRAASGSATRTDTRPAGAPGETATAISLGMRYDF
jgi:predicted porin